MHCKSKVFIDPNSKIVYSSFYIQGLYAVFGKRNVSFSAKYFRELKRKQESYSHDRYVPFVVITPNKNILKVIIDFCDPPGVSENAYKWCDHYAKINFNLYLTENKFHNKMISIPPGFGIKIWNFWETAFNCCLNYIRCKFSPLVSLKSFIKDYFWQFKRPTLDDYINDNNLSHKPIGTEPFVFMIGTLWKQKNCIEETNLLRKTFIETCKALNCNFEGGFFASVNHPQYEEFKDLIFVQRYSIKNYIQKTKLSKIVFNTPAVYNCHGWKLGEYLAMNKAIISTPISNELPEKLVHGKNIHIISNEKELELGINLLLKDNDYRISLEAEAKAYYLKYANPQSVIKNILINNNTTET